jgi:hypothetical protein
MHTSPPTVPSACATRSPSIDTGDGAIGMNAPGNGINGALTQRQGPPPEGGGPVNGCNVVVSVDGSIDELFQKGLDLGAAEALPLDDMQGIGRVGYLLDPIGTSSGSSDRCCPTAVSRWAVAERHSGPQRRQTTLAGPAGEQ